MIVPPHIPNAKDLVDILYSDYISLYVTREPTTRNGKFNHESTFMKKFKSTYSRHSRTSRNPSVNSLSMSHISLN